MRISKLLAAAAVLGLAGTAWAYMLPGGSLIRKMQAKRDEQPLHSVVVHGSFTLTGPAAQAMAQKLGRFAEGGELSVPAVASYKMPGRCRIELEPQGLANDKRPFAVDRNGQVSGSDELKAGQLMLLLGCPLLAARGGDESARVLIEWAKAAGVEFGTLSLARFNNTIAEVIGAGPHDKLKPQLWIDKDDFVPLRVIMKQGTAFYDLRIDPGAGILDAHPRTLELWQMGTGSEGEQLLGRFSAEKIEPNAKVDDKLF